MFTFSCNQYVYHIYYYYLIHNILKDWTHIVANGSFKKLVINKNLEPKVK